MFRFPDSPEGVALALAHLIAERRKGTEKEVQDLLVLYKRCLAVVNGEGAPLGEPIH